ncbi:MAG: hypothetical protein Q9219_006255 [cf. Caloplaca sp. 3 TL-2023]
MAPCKSIDYLLDLGCGSGIWTAAIAAEYPETTVWGIDITPPTNSFWLDNLQFSKADVEKEWDFGDETLMLFDIITIRVLVSSIRDWPSLFRRCFEHLKPGGWVEIPDITIGTFSDALDWQDERNPLMRWYRCYRKGASSYGIDGFANKQRATELANEGFTSTSEKYFDCYLDEDAVTEPRDKEIARLMRRNVFGLLDAVTKTMLERSQWDLLQVSADELQRLKQEAKDDIVSNAASRKYHWIL